MAAFTELDSLTSSSFQRLSSCSMAKQPNNYFSTKGLEVENSSVSWGHLKIALTRT